MARTFYDEMYDRGGAVRPHYREFARWMSRYLERAENLARMLDVSYSLSLMPQDGHDDGFDELAMPLLITDTLDEYLARHGQMHAERMLHFFALDADNPASIYCCLKVSIWRSHETVD